MKLKILLIVIIIIAVVQVMPFARQKVLGNMNHKITEARTYTSDFSFPGNEGDRIKISLRTDVKGGSVDFVISDSNGDVVEKVDRAKALETFVNLPKDDTYTMTAICKDFQGKYNMKVSIRRF